MTTSPDFHQLNRDELIEVAESAFRRADDLQQRAEELQRRVDWFSRQLFGKKSEARAHRVEDTSTETQLWLGGDLHKPSEEIDNDETITIEQHKRKVRGAKQRGAGFVTSEGLRFGPETPIREVILPEGDETRDLPADKKEYLPPDICYKIAQHKSAYFVEKTVRPKVKIKGTEPVIYTAPAPPSVIPGSLAALSFLVGLIITKYRYHIPLYRLHQMLKATGIVISRMTLTTLEHKLGELLTPLANAIHALALSRRVLLMDETPHKVWVEGLSKLQLQYMWLIYTETEVFFAMGPGRTHDVVYQLLGLKREYILVTDGYDAYDNYARHPDARILHAYCWVHFRRQWIEAEKQDPATVKVAIKFIQGIYEVEREIKNNELTGDDKKSFRQEHAKPIVDSFHEWLQETYNKNILLPKSPIAAACNYGLTRWKGLEIFLDEPDVPADTNEGEREMRPHALGRKNWLFNMSERGSDYVAVFYTILQTCKLNGVDPHDYLMDVLPQLSNASISLDDARALTPLNWKKQRENTS